MLSKYESHKGDINTALAPNNRIWATHIKGRSSSQHNTFQSGILPGLSSLSPEDTALVIRRAFEILREKIEKNNPPLENQTSTAALGIVVYNEATKSKILYSAICGNSGVLSYSSQEGVTTCYTRLHDLNSLVQQKGPELTQLTPYIYRDPLDGEYRVNPLHQDKIRLPQSQLFRSLGKASYNNEVDIYLKHIPNDEQRRYLLAASNGLFGLQVTDPQFHTYIRNEILKHGKTPFTKDELSNISAHESVQNTLRNLEKRHGPIDFNQFVNAVFDTQISILHANENPTTEELLCAVPMAFAFCWGNVRRCTTVTLRLAEEDFPSDAEFIAVFDGDEGSEVSSILSREITNALQTAITEAIRCIQTIPALSTLYRDLQVNTSSFSNDLLTLRCHFIDLHQYIDQCFDKYPTIKNKLKRLILEDYLYRLNPNTQQLDRMSHEILFLIKFIEKINHEFTQIIELLKETEFTNTPYFSNEVMNFFMQEISNQWNNRYAPILNQEISQTRINLLFMSRIQNIIELRKKIDGIKANNQMPALLRDCLQPIEEWLNSHAYNSPASNLIDINKLIDAYIDNIANPYIANHRALHKFISEEPRANQEQSVKEKVDSIIQQVNEFATPMLASLMQDSKKLLETQIALNSKFDLSIQEHLEDLCLLYVEKYITTRHYEGCFPLFQRAKFDPYTLWLQKVILNLITLTQGEDYLQELSKRIKDNSSLSGKHPEENNNIILCYIKLNLKKEQIRDYISQRGLLALNSPNLQKLQVRLDINLENLNDGVRTPLLT